MRIAFVTIKLYGGGAEKSNLNIIRILQDLGHIVDVFSIVKSKNSNELKREFNVFYAEDNRYTSLKRFDKFLSVFSYLKNEKYDAVIDGRTRVSFFKELFFQKILFSNINNKIFIVHNSNLDLYFFKNKLINDFFYRKTLLISVSNKIKEKIISQYNYKKTTYIRNCYDSSIDFVTTCEQVLEKEYFLYYGRLENKSKNILFLIEAYFNAKLKGLNIDFVIMGEGEDEELFKNEVVKYNLSDNVKFLPFKSTPYEVVKNARFTVMASNYEGFPMTLIESLALNVPVVTTDFESGPSEIIISGENGILLKEKEVIAFSECLLKMCLDEKFYEKCVNGSRNSVEKFSFTSVSKQWEKFLKGI